MNNNDKGAEKKTRVWWYLHYNVVFSPRRLFSAILLLENQTVVWCDSARAKVWSVLEDLPSWELLLSCLKKKTILTGFGKWSAVSCVCWCLMFWQPIHPPWPNPCVCTHPSTCVCRMPGVSVQFLSFLGYSFSSMWLQQLRFKAIHHATSAGWGVGETEYVNAFLSDVSGRKKK